jgi:hypothetical protein
MPETTDAAEAAANKEKTLTIIVNGRERTVETKELSFEDVLKLAFDPVPSGPNWEFTVSYRRGEGKKHEGSLLPGETVKVKDGMIFVATATDKS